MRRPSRERPRPSDVIGERDDDGRRPGGLDVTELDENRLHPTPIPGLDFLEPNLELVNPLDWFLQPITGELSGYRDVEISVSPDGCRVCVSVTGTAGWLTTPTASDGAGFCYTFPDCREPPPEPPKPPRPPFEPPPVPGINVPIQPGDHVEIILTPIYSRVTYIPNCKGDSGEVVEGIVDSRPRSISYIAGESDTITAALVAQEVFGGAFFRYRCPGETSKAGRNGLAYSVVVKAKESSANGLVILDTHSSTGLNGSTRTRVADAEDSIEILVNEEPKYPLPPEDKFRRAPPPPPPPEEEGMKCCRNSRDNTAILRKIARAVGINDFPITAPASFNRLKDGNITLSSIPQLQSWAAVQVSDLVGEFPKKIEIEDASLVEDGNQSIEINLPNLSESIADMYGSMVRTNAVNEVLLAFCTRLAMEVSSIKAATLVAQSYAKANANALGYKFNEEKITVPFAFDFDANMSKLEDMLKGGNKKVTIFNCEEEASAWEYLERLMFVASITKEKFLGKDTSLLTDTIQRIKDSGLFGDDNLTAFLEKLKQDGFYNDTSDMSKPNVED